MSWEKTTAGERLEFLARHHKVSLRELSREAGRSPTHAEQLVNQGQKGMRADSALGYSRRWNVTIDWLTEGKGEPFESVRTIVSEAIPDELQRVLDADPPEGRRGEYTPEALAAAMTSYRADGARRTEEEWCAILDHYSATTRVIAKRFPPRILHDDPTETKKESSMKRKNKAN